MIKSMTGFGRASGAVNGINVTMEVKSLNSKFLEINLRLPAPFRDREMDIRMYLTKVLERGRVDISISMDESMVDTGVSLNTKAASGYIAQLKDLCNANGIDMKDIMPAFLQLPNITGMQRTDTSDETFAALQSLTAEAISRFNEFRAKEGSILMQDLLQCLTTIESDAEQVAANAPKRAENIRQRILQQLQSNSDNIVIDHNRFEQELIYYLERIDINEERVRLHSHCNYFRECIHAPDVSGKKLGFILQEIGREINTMGAKANDAAIQKMIIGMKDDLEKMKEQILNVL
ncbi:MAG: YicC family protein [Bacteroidetes bacterium]|nr:YicC family protein [Bacteroidota bacterium]